VVRVCLQLRDSRDNNCKDLSGASRTFPWQRHAGTTMSNTRICTSCGAETSSGARFCASCGAPLSPNGGVEGELRKTVTVLFCDVTGSTQLAEALDPETVRHLMLRYFDEMARVIERHGGVVEKYIGDAVMAVFGVPQIHEDDALRAVRAAAEMRDALSQLNEELDRAYGATLATRIGVNTGEVVAGEPGLDQRLVTGDAVNVAARLEQNAKPGEILLGDPTYRLVRAAVSVEAVEQLTLKGKADRVPAWRLLEVDPGAPGWVRRLDSPLVDREEELRVLLDQFERTVSARSCQIVTAIGSAGVGKSRLSGELVTHLSGRALVARGRCLPYGEGITFWPVVGALRDIAAIGESDTPTEAAAKVGRLMEGSPDGALVEERLAPLLGPGDEVAIQETFWAVRKLFEHVGSQMPLVLVLDDIQWGEHTFLDLVEYLADWITTAPVFILCLARPELLEVRAGWTSGKPNAAIVTVEPLTGPDTDELIRGLIGGAELSSEARARISELAEGNPLFVEESIRMLVDDGLLVAAEDGWIAPADLGDVAIPATIQAILTARLERLDPEERAVMERASVIGRVFWWGAVSELTPGELRPRVAGHLQSLMRKELIRPDFERVGRDDAFRFTHILVRDVAYQEIPKSVRVELHSHLAEWIETRTQDRAGEYEEIIGYHLEQASRSLLDLGPVSERATELARAAAIRLASAGDRAYTRGDMPAAVSLLERASSLLEPNAVERAALLPELAFALLETGNLERLQEVTRETRAAAQASGDRRLQGHASILAMWIRLFTDPVEGWAEEAHRQAVSAGAAFEDVGDERGLAKASALLALVHTLRCRFAEAESTWETAADHARRAGDRRDEMESRAWVPLTVWAGPAHVDAGLERCRSLFARAEGDRKLMSSALMAQAAFVAGLGRFDEARELLAQARALAQEVALPLWEAGPLAQVSGWVETFASDPAAAEHALRTGYEKLQEIGEIAWFSTTAALLAETVYQQDRLDEAEELTRASQEWAVAEDAYSQAGWRSVRAKVLARGGNAEEAERLAAECVELAEATDFLHLRWRALMSQGEVLQLTGRASDGAAVLGKAVAVAEQKGNAVAADQARALLRQPVARR
jgi:class 3 adenylate cyclase/tetratricopeptide (TPR) repeat protein